MPELIFIGLGSGVVALLSFGGAVRQTIILAIMEKTGLQ